MVLLCFSSCKSQDSDRAIVDSLDAYFSAIYAPEDPGAAVLLLKGDSIYFEKGYGRALMDSGTPADPETFFCIASVSKQFSAVALMLLAQDGLLSIDDPLALYFPEFKADFYKKITLRHLLSHSSGIPDARSREDRDFVYHALDRESCAYLDTLSFLNFEPGTAYEYMNPTFQLMYMIVEQVSGMPFETFMRRRIFDPAGMAETVYFEDGREIPHLSHGYAWNEDTKTWDECDYDEAAFFPTKADGGLYTSVEEFVQWEKAIRKNLLMTEESKREAHRVHTPVPDIPYTGYGYGWFIEEKPGFPKKVYHTGDNGGYQIYACRYPEQQILVLVFSTREIDRTAYMSYIDEVLKKGGWLD